MRSRSTALALLEMIGQLHKPFRARPISPPTSQPPLDHLPVQNSRIGTVALSLALPIGAHVECVWRQTDTTCEIRLRFSG